MAKQNYDNPNNGTSGSLIRTVNTGNDFVFLIGVRNSSPVDAPQVVVEYVIYNKTTSGSGSVRTITIEEIKGTQTISVPGNGNTSLRSLRIPGTDTTTSINRHGVSSSSARTGAKTIAADRTELMGIYITAKINGVVVAKEENPTGVRVKAELNKK